MIQWSYLFVSSSWSLIIIAWTFLHQWDQWSATKYCELILPYRPTSSIHPSIHPPIYPSIHPSQTPIHPPTNHLHQLCCLPSFHWKIENLLEMENVEPFDLLPLRAPTLFLMSNECFPFLNSVFLIATFGIWLLSLCGDHNTLFWPMDIELYLQVTHSLNNTTPRGS